jgi:hypothetical protein
MNLQSIAATIASHLFGRLLRRVLLSLAIAALAIVALYHFTAAGLLALETRFSDLHAQLIVAGIYTALAAIALTILWATSRNRPTPNAATLDGTREMQLAMLIEAAMRGYSLARKGKRTR